MGGPLSTPCARARPGASSTSSWRGRLIDLAGRCKTSFLTELHALKIDLYLYQQGVDTTTPGGKALFQMMGVFAEFERSIIQDRIHAGLARARAQGKRLGRPSIPVTIERKIRDALKKGGTGIRKLAAKHHVGVGTVQRIKRELDR